MAKDEGAGGDAVLSRLAAAIEARKNADPQSSYVASLFARGDDAILKKIGEEATETVMAAKDGDKLRITAEVADLWFHCLVLLARHGLGPADVLDSLVKLCPRVITIRGVLVQADGDGFDYSGDLKKPNQGDLNEVVDLDLQQMLDRADLSFAPRLTRRLFPRHGVWRLS